MNVRGDDAGPHVRALVVAIVVIAGIAALVELPLVGLAMLVAAAVALAIASAL